MGNNWGCDEEGNCGVGLGKKQETFVNCADIKITSEGGTSGRDAPLTEQTSTRAPLTGSTPGSKPPKTQKPSTTSCYTSCYLELRPSEITGF